MTNRDTIDRLGRRLKRGVVRLTIVAAAIVIGYCGFCTTLIITYRWIDPPTTTVQIQRHVEALIGGREYSRTYKPRPVSEISPHIPTSAIAAEDGRFFEHGGFDWDSIETAMSEGRGRGASTISQQLAKNLFLTTHRSYFRKGLELPLTFLIELLLPKERIIELYVNVVEWGDGIFGAEAAARYHYGTDSRDISRRQAAAMAACLPDPRRRRPQLDGRYTNIILRRMDRMGY